MGIMLGVATLIIVMAVMNGFRAELLGRILGINAHMSVSRYGQPMTDYDALVEKLKTIPGVKYAAPVIEGQVMATANGSSTGAVVKVMRDKDLMARTMVSTKIVEGNINEFHGLDTVIIGARMAFDGVAGRGLYYAYRTKNYGDIRRCCAEAQGVPRHRTV